MHDKSAVIVVGFEDYGEGVAVCDHRVGMIAFAVRECDLNSFHPVRLVFGCSDSTAGKNRAHVAAEIDAKSGNEDCRRRLRRVCMIYFLEGIDELATLAGTI